VLHYLSGNCYCKFKKRCLQRWQFFKVWILESSNKERKPVKLWIIVTLQNYKLYTYTVEPQLRSPLFTIFPAFNILFQWSQNHLGLELLPFKIFLHLVFKATALQWNHKCGFHCIVAASQFHTENLLGIQYELLLQAKFVSELFQHSCLISKDF
jgi:hypothetical protein